MTSFLGRSIGGRLAVGLSDSAVSSAGNLGVSIIVAHTASLSEFGIFTTAMLILILATMLSRSSHGEALIMKSGELDAAGVDADRQRSTTSVMQLCTMLGLVTVSVGVLMGLLNPSGFDSVAMTVIVSGTALPLLCLQDHLRWIEYARGTSQRALVNNSLWTVFSIGSLVVAWVAVGSGIPAHVCLMIWAYSTVPGTLYAVVYGPIPLQVRGRPEWLRLNRPLVAPLVMDLSLTQATAQGATLVVAALSSAVDMAFIRKGQIWMGVATVITMGLLSALQPILTERAAARGDGAVRLAAVVGAVAGGGVLLYGLVVGLLPAEVAQVLVGSGWTESRPFVWPLTILAAASIMGGCLGLAMRTSGLLGRQVRWRLVLAPASVVVVAVTTRLDGALAGMWSLAAVAVVTALTWSVLLAQSGQDRRRQRVSYAL